VCDSGSGLVKCGFAGDQFPRSAFPCVTGRAVYGDPGASEPPLVGRDCQSQRSGMQVRSPMSHGVVQDWAEMAHVWRHAFHRELGVTDPGECKVIMTEPPLNSAANRERLLQAMFETFGFAAAYVQNQAVLTLYAQGLLTGLVLDAGHGTTHAVCPCPIPTSITFGIPEGVTVATWVKLMFCPQNTQNAKQYASIELLFSRAVARQGSPWHGMLDVCASACAQRRSPSWMASATPTSQSACRCRGSSSRHTCWTSYHAAATR